MGRVDQADRGHVHRGAAVDDVAGAGLARVHVAVVDPCDQPFLREEDPLERQRLGLQFRDPARVRDQVRDQVFGDRVGVEVVAHRAVDAHQRVRHQGVVGDVPVALVVWGDRPGGAPGVAVPGTDDAVDAAAVAFDDLLGE